MPLLRNLTRIPKKVSSRRRVQAYWRDLLVVLAIAVVVFGPKKLPELAKIH